MPCSLHQPKFKDYLINPWESIERHLYHVSNSQHEPSLKARISLAITLPLFNIRKLFENLLKGALNTPIAAFHHLGKFKWPLIGNFGEEVRSSCRFNIIIKKVWRAFLQAALTPITFVGVLFFTKDTRNYLIKSNLIKDSHEKIVKKSTKLQEKLLLIKQGLPTSSDKDKLLSQRYQLTQLYNTVQTFQNKFAKWNLNQFQDLKVETLKTIHSIQALYEDELTSPPVPVQLV